MLENLGYEVDVAENGANALKMFSDKYALILLDIGLPDIDGVEVSQRIRELDTGKLVPIIVLTERSIHTISDECRVAGIDEVVAKPVTTEELGCLINRYLKVISDKPDIQVN